MNDRGRKVERFFVSFSLAALSCHGGNDDVLVTGDGGGGGTSREGGGIGGDGGVPGTEGGTAIHYNLDGGSGEVTDGGFGAWTPKPTARGGTLALRIGGTARGVDYDSLEVNGKATLAGSLVVVFTGSYRPPSQTRFTVVQAAGGVTGGFDTITTNGIAVVGTQDATHYFITVK